MDTLVPTGESPGNFPGLSPIYFSQVTVTRVNHACILRIAGYMHAPSALRVRSTRVQDKSCDLYEETRHPVQQRRRTRAGQNIAAPTPNV